MNKRNPLVIGLGFVALLTILALAWWFVSPLFVNKVVDEAFPIIPETAQVEMETAVDDPTVNRRDDMMDDMEEVDKTAEVIADADADPAMAEQTMAEAEPILIKEGMFRNGGPSYSGSGRAAIYRLPDGSHILRLEDFSVTNGPDLRVLLATHQDPQTSDALHSQANVELEPLKGNQGNQNYAIPAGVDIANQWSVVIYCKPFSVIFSVAPLSQ
jgi:Na+-transporting methylmalonyl-CoA/oxaloacetate decarboxylase gamma subunit